MWLAESESATDLAFISCGLQVRSSLQPLAKTWAFGTRKHEQTVLPYRSNGQETQSAHAQLKRTYISLASRRSNKQLQLPTVPLISRLRLSSLYQPVTREIIGPVVYCIDNLPEQGKEGSETFTHERQQEEEALMRRRTSPSMIMQRKESTVPGSVSLPSLLMD